MAAAPIDDNIVQALGTHSADHQRQRLQVLLAYRALRARLRAQSTTAQWCDSRAAAPMPSQLTWATHIHIILNHDLPMSC